MTVSFGIPFIEKIHVFNNVLLFFFQFCLFPSPFLSILSIKELNWARISFRRRIQTVIRSEKEDRNIWTFNINNDRFKIYILYWIYSFFNSEVSNRFYEKQVWGTINSRSTFKVWKKIMWVGVGSFYTFI